MKVLSKATIIENEEFVLIEDKHENGKTYYGTIPYSEIDEHGKLKRTIYGYEMCISFENPADAIIARKNAILMTKFKEEEHSEEEIIKFAAKLAGIKI